MHIQTGNPKITMFNLPVISNSSRHSPESCGMMHLNALNGSCQDNDLHHHLHGDSGGCISSAAPPSFDEAFTNAPLFGLFSSGGSESSHHSHHHHHPQFHQSTSLHHSSPVSSGHVYSSPRDRSPGGHVRCSLPSVGTPGHTPPTYVEKQQLSPGENESGCDVTRTPATERPASRNVRSREEGGSTRVVERFEVEEQCGRLSRIGIVGGGSALQSILSAPKSPRIGGSSRNKQQKESHASNNRKNGNGNTSRQKPSNSEKSVLTVAKDRLYRVLSPMFSRKHEGQAQSPTKVGSKQKTFPSLSTGNDSSEEEEETTSHPVRVRLPSGRARSPCPDRFDDLGWGSDESSRRNKLHPTNTSNPHHNH